MGIRPGLAAKDEDELKDARWIAEMLNDRNDNKAWIGSLRFKKAERCWIMDMAKRPGLADKDKDGMKVVWWIAHTVFLQKWIVNE